MKINTGLDNFLLIDKVFEINSDYILTGKYFKDSEYFLLIEAMAQTAALHSRFLNNFEKHSFLLSIKDLKFSQEKLNSSQKIKAKIISKSENANLYEVTSYSDCGEIIDAQITISSVKYNNNFEREKIKKRYKQVFKCLQEN